MPTDETEVKQDNKTSVDQKQTSPATYTEEQVKERERKARSDALAEAGRFKAEAEKASKASQAALERLNRMEQERIDAELETHKDDPAEVRRIRAEQKARQIEADLDKERDAKTDLERRLQVIEAERAEYTKTTVAQTIAKEYKVDPDKLAKLAKLTDGSEQAIKALAEEMPRVSQSKTFKPDNNRSVGGLLTWEDVRAAYIKDPYNPANKQRYLEMQRANSVVRK